MNKPNFVSRDTINYFYHVGAKYPEMTIVDSDSRLFASLFRQKKAFAIIKSTDIPELEQIDAIDMQLYRYATMLFVQISMHVPHREKPIITVLPIHSRKDNLISPNYPIDAEVMQFEIHLINHFRHNELSKVVRFHISDLSFQDKLVELYKYQAASDIEDGQISIDLKAFLNIPFGQRDTHLECSTTCVIDKQEPDAYEPPRMDIMDGLSTMVS